MNLASIRMVFLTEAEAVDAGAGVGVTWHIWVSRIPLAAPGGTDLKEARVALGDQLAVAAVRAGTAVSLLPVSSSGLVRESGSRPRLMGRSLHSALACLSSVPGSHFPVSLPDGTDSFSRSSL